MSAPRFHRIASGDYQTSDGRFLLWRAPDVYPPAWNVEDTSTYSLIVDGAATKRDAIALFTAAFTTGRANSQLYSMNR